MGPVQGQNPIQRTVRTAYLSVLMTVCNFSTQYNTEQFDNLPSYLQTNIIAQMLSTGGEGVSIQGHRTLLPKCPLFGIDRSIRSETGPRLFLVSDYCLRHVGDLVENLVLSRF